MKTTARAILATEQGQATIRGFIANVRESAGPKAHMESELAAQLIEAKERIVELESAIEAAPKRSET